MNKSRLSLFIVLSVLSCSIYGQSNKKAAYYFDNPIVVDSSSSIIIPTRYNADFFSSNKIAVWGDYYANIVFYNIKTDSSRRLFEKDTYIMGFNNYYSNRYNYKPENNMTPQWLFFRVKNIDHNQSGRIDENDPTILYVCDIHGNGLKALTSENENVISVDLYKKMNLALVKIQRDHDGDGDFENEDKDYYYVRLDLASMTFGNKIEIR